MAISIHVRGLFSRVVDAHRITISWVAALVILALSSVGAGASDILSEEQQVAKLGQLLKKQDVTRVSPDSLVRVAQQDPHFLALAGSEAGEDHFFEAYEQTLRPITNKRFPQARHVRGQLIEVFNLVNDFFEDVFGSGSGFGHYRNRIPGYLEWYLYSGYESSFSLPFSTRYGLDDIRTVGEVVVRANWEERTTVLVEGPRDVTSALKRFLPPLDRAIGKLRTAEKNLPEAGRYYFRQRVMAELARFLSVPNFSLPVAE